MNYFEFWFYTTSLCVKLFTLINIINIILQIIYLKKIKKANKNKIIARFLGLNIAGLITAIIGSFVIFEFDDITKYTGDMGSGFAIALECGILLGIYIIILIIGLIIKKKHYHKKVAPNKPYILIFLICVFIIPLAFTKSIYAINVFKGEKIVLKYLNNKYGDNNYKVIDSYIAAKRNYFNKSFDGHYYEIKMTNMENSFVVQIDKQFKHIESDYLLPIYYSEKLNLAYQFKYDTLIDYEIKYDFKEFDNYFTNAIQEQLNDKITISIKDLYKNFTECNNSSNFKYCKNYNIIPENYGKIPTVAELENLLIKYYNSKS